MEDKEFFHRVLGLEEPWSVHEAKLDLPGKRPMARLGIDGKSFRRQRRDGMPVNGLALT